MKQLHILATLLALLASSLPAATLRMSRAEYEDRINAAWTAEIIGTLMGFQFEHKASSVERIDKIPPRFTEAPVDDDFYYEMVAIRGFEKYGINMTARTARGAVEREQRGILGLERAGPAPPGARREGAAIPDIRATTAYGSPSDRSSARTYTE